MRPTKRLRAHHLRAALVVTLRHERNIQRTLADHLIQIDRRLTDHREFDARIGAGEPRHDFGQEPVGIIVRRADAHMTFQLGIVERRNCLAIELHHTTRVEQEPITIFRKTV